MRLKSFLQFFSGLAAVLTLFPLIAADYWWIRVFDFPHFQLTTLTLIAILTYLIRFDIRWTNDYLFMAVMLGCFSYQAIKIYPYTPLAKLEVKESIKDKEETTFSIFAANVLQTNEEYQLLLDALGEYDPDIILLTETNHQWKEAVAPEIRKRYKYRVEAPLENTYGMLFYSKFPLIDPEVQTIVDDSIPSIHTKLQLPSGQNIQFYCIHPTPPMPQHNPKSTDRDAELMKIALLSRENKLPVIVLGDFNDVAWSRTTSLFQRVSGLLDIRKGRGFFNTYHAQYPIFRWPLDHIFISDEFAYKKMELGRKINSDHFPIFTRLSYEPENRAGIEIPEASAEDIEMAMEMIKQERREDTESGN